MPESHQPLPIPDAIALTCRRGALLGRNRLPFLSLALALLITPGLAVDELSPLVVTATRAPAPAAQLPVTVEVIRGDSFQRGPAFVVDDALKASAAFSLFRRTNSLMAHPTAQGVSLRNLGPSGAGRTLVLLDGVPLNDPFGGWVTWTKIPRLTLSGAEIVRGGGSSAWGSAALGGTLQFLSAPLELAPDHAAAGRHRTQLLAEVGEASTGSAEFLSETRGDQHGLQVSGRVFRTDGFWRVPAADRGSIDRRTDGEHQVAQLSWQHASTTGRDSRLPAQPHPGSVRGRPNRGTASQRPLGRHRLPAVADLRQPLLLSQPRPFVRNARPGPIRRAGDRGRSRLHRHLA
jgi:outer membrane receptor protein involved in Fe transport